MDSATPLHSPVSEKSALTLPSNVPIINLTCALTVNVWVTKITVEPSSHAQQLIQSDAWIRHVKQNHAQQN